MKYLILSLSLFSVTTISYGWEFESNPDRFPSVGINVNTTQLVGDRAEIDQPSPILTRNQGGPIKSTYDSIGVDLRLPVSNHLTFTFYGDSIRSDDSFKRKGDQYKETNTVSGARYGFSVRMYFNK